MQKITSSAGLKNAIQLLEAEQAIKGAALKEQFYLTYNSFSPFNLLKSTLNSLSRHSLQTSDRQSDVTSSTYLINNILGTVIGLATGYLSKKIVVGASGNIFRKLFGSFLQLGVTNLVAQHPDAIKSFGQFIIEHIFRKTVVSKLKTEDSSQ